MVVLGLICLVMAILLGFLHLLGASEGVNTLSFCFGTLGLMIFTVQLYKVPAYGKMSVFGLGELRVWALVVTLALVVGLLGRLVSQSRANNR